MNIWHRLLEFLLMDGFFLLSIIFLALFFRVLLCFELNMCEEIEVLDLGGTTRWKNEVIDGYFRNLVIVDRL